MEQLYYSDPSIKALDELKSKYFNEVKTQGINPTSFKENKMEFLTYGYQRDGTVLELETSSDEEITKLANIKMTGITVQYQFKAEVNPEQRAKIIAKAIANAKDNATRVCKVANKKLGEIISISDSSVQDSTWNSYSSTYEEYATIYVTYEMN